jgi:hypothetical protein
LWLTTPATAPAPNDRSRAGLGDTDRLEVVANVALTTFTNYLNEVAGTDIDFPLVTHRPR